MALGGYLSYDEEETLNVNFSTKISQMKNTLNTWKQRNLSLKGRIYLAKSLVLSVFCYTVSLLPVAERVIHAVNKLNRELFWKGKRSKVKYSLLCNSYEKVVNKCWISKQ